MHEESNGIINGNVEIEECT